jgi:hypothetical protein
MINLDAAATLLSSLQIPDYESQAMVNFRFKPSQITLLNRFKKQQQSGKPVRAIICKSRRFGGSSLVDGLALTHCIGEENVNALIVAHRKDSAEALFRVPLTLIKGLSAAGYDIPEPTQKKITFPHPGGDSSLSIATAGDVLGGRGAAFSFLHLSEAAGYQGKAPFTSLLSTVADHRSTFLVVESTANKKIGPGQAFYEMWCDAVYGKSEYDAIFIGFIDDILCRRDALEAKDAPANDEEKDIIALVACSDNCGRCEKCHKALECVAWRRWAVINKCQGDADLFMQEFPYTWEQAFITPQNPAFTRDELRVARSMIREPIAIGRLERDVSPARDPGRPIILIPDDRSPLHIWKYPEERHHYYIGADAARGQDNKDYAAAFVWEGETGETCARYASRINPESLAELLNFLGIYYMKAMLAVELTGNLGLWCQKVLRDSYQYPNLYRWKGRDDRQPVGYVVRTSIGWETTARTRPMLLDAMRTAIRFGRCKLYDAATLSQMESAEMIEGKWIVRVGHDDLMMSAMIGWLTGEQWHTAGMSSSKVLDIEASVPSKSDDDRKVIKDADADVQGMVRKHWSRIMAYNRYGPPKSGRGLDGI